MNASRFAVDLSARGLLYAIANDRIHAPLPLDAEKNWQLWTEPKSALLQLLSRAYPPKSLRVAYLNEMLDSDHSQGIEAHYDISNDFYALFLDSKYRFYTCAEFKNDTETLEQAQTNKAQYLLSLLKLDGDEKILDLGCGWGAMLRFLQDTGHRGELTGFTLSKEQKIYACEQLDLNVSLTDFITHDFKPAAYDRILSIGSLEHVRPNELEQLYQKTYDALVPGGLAVHQFFSLVREAYPTSMVTIQLFFPGSLLVMHHTHIAAAERAGFKITHDSIHDYRPTLRAWYERLVANQAQALELVGLEIFNRYMTFFPLSWLFFQQHEAELHRIVMAKPA
ncbi:class I SAM-dependent methyltransferase [Chamaesiphon sp. GL140_3_metabinner_50]|uniref:class I SAM-dependent methyltransferase n=1 Tax=Chamaesiphon sp. GL140_3_metabinner_50 TaxID=2970812 RepID=UPI0025D8E272|nr:class I SAM-dependent methyltransferase [Chamaesiphon sp. GL140_3_metabinner_50]